MVTSAPALHLRVRLDIAYDGTDFSGWAAQPGLRTVQGTLEAALARILPAAVRLTVAGRTDAGVHALGQVAHLDLDAPAQTALRGSRRGVETKSDDELALALGHRLGGVLNPEGDLTVRAAQLVSLDFDARFSALWRAYSYRIADRLTPANPLRRRDTLRLGMVRLDLAAMQAAADALVGLSDFATFCKARPEATTIRELQQFRFERDHDGTVIATVRADAFCHSMVRALIGGCLAVGTGRLTDGELGELHRRAERTSRFAVVPPHGLTLVEVGYPEPSEWAARAQQIRARRDLADADLSSDEVVA